MRFLLSNIAFLHIAVCVLQAQPITYFVEEFNAEHGLPNNWVYDMTQDTLGFLWFATSDGIIRYDGYQFESFTKNVKDSTSIQGRRIRDIDVDAQGNLWVYNNGEAGLFRFNPITQSFLHIAPELDTKWYNRVVHLGNGSTWAGTIHGMFELDPNGNVLQHHLPNPKPSDNPAENAVTPLLEIEEGKLWVSLFAKGIYLFDTKTGSFTPVGGPLNEEASIFTTKALRDSANTIWMASLEKGLIRYNVKTQEVLQFSPDPTNSQDRASHISNIMLTQGGALWASSPTGVKYIFNKQAKQLDRVQLITVGTGSTFQGEDCMFEDRSEVIWFCSQGGLARLDPNFSRFYYETQLPGPLGIPIEGIAGSVKEDRDGTLWYATVSSGLMGYHPTTGETSYVEYAPGNPTALIPAPINDMEIGRDNTIWLALYAPSGGLQRFDPSTGTHTLYQHDPDDSTSLSNNEVDVVYEDNQGSLWVGTYSDFPGFHHFNKETESFTRYAHSPTDSTSICGNNIIDIQEDREGTLWISTEICLSKFDRSTESFTNYTDLYLVQGIYEDTKGRFWVAASDGLHKFDRDTGTSILYSTREGLVHDTPRNIQEDALGYIWIGTSSGLSRLNPETNHFINFNTDNGLPETRFFERSANQTSSGLFYYGTRTGFISFDPLTITENRHPPEIRLTAMTINGNPVSQGGTSILDRPLWHTSAITLPHTQNDFSFTASALHFSHPELNQYAYMLENHDQGWIQSGYERTAHYSNVPPGSYTFRVKAANADGIWNEIGTALNVQILPPWWQTTWAYLLYALAVGGMMFGANRLQRQLLIAEERQQAQIREAQLETKALQAENERKQLEIEKGKELEKSYRELQQALAHLRETQDQLVHTEKLASLGQLTAGIAHEIKNPLNFVNNFSRLSKDMMEELEEWIEQHNIQPDEDLEDIIGTLKMNVAKIHHHGNRADGIVKSMLEHSRTEPGQQRATDVNKLLDEYVNLAFHSWKAAHSEDNVPTVIREYDNTVGEINLIPQNIGRVLINLLDNALYAIGESGDTSPESGVVKVSTVRNGEHVEIRIADNGTGIPNDIQSKIFEPFFTTKPTGSGTGLGLSLSYDIVVQGHGGELTVESEEGKGAVFSLLLPA